MALTLENVSVTRGKRPILRDVSATFEPGRVTVILGPNGAGKSTLLQVAAGLLRAEGRMLLDGQDVARMPAQERARAIGYLPQDATVHWDMTVEEVVALGRLPYGDRDATAIEGAMEQTGTAGFARRRVSTLSGGERSRVLLARVLAGRPRWFLADEPLASLDPVHAIDTLKRLRKLARTGVGVAVIMHDALLAAYVSDDAILVEQNGSAKAGKAEDHITLSSLEALYSVPFAVVKTEARMAFIPRPFEAH